MNKLPPSQRWAKIQRAQRLKKIARAQRELEEELLALSAMYGRETHEYKRARAAFGHLYYLVNLAKRSPQ